MARRPRAGNRARPGAWLLRALTRLFAIDVRSLAVLRIGLGGILLVDLAERVRYLDVNYTDQGVLPREALAGSWSLHALGGGLAFEAAVFAVAALFAAMLAVGYRTRLATLASWVLLVSLHNRSLPLTDGGDVLLRMLLLWSAFLPLGACWSLDAVRERGADGAEPAVCSVATVALMIQLLLLYDLGGLNKSGPDWRVTGVAIERALEQTYWSRPAGQLLTRFPELLRMMSFGVPWFEVIAPLLMFVPVATALLRMVAIAAFVMFQLGLGVCIQLHLFPWISTAALLPFVPTGVWDRLVRPPPATSRPSGRWLRDAVVGLLVVYAVAAALSSLGLVELPAGLERIANRLGVIEGWAMYAPQSAQRDLHFDLVTQRADGTAEDLLAEGPERLRRLHGTYRFKYFLEAMLRGGEQIQLRRYYLRWACRVWKPDGTAYLFVAMRTLPDGPWQRTLLLYEDCRAAPPS